MKNSKSSEEKCKKISQMSKLTGEHRISQKITIHKFLKQLENKWQKFYSHFQN